MQPGVRRLLADILLGISREEIDLRARSMLQAEALERKMRRQRHAASRAHRERRDLEHREATAELAEKVLSRAGPGYCELGDHPTMDARELHHLDGGSGKRRQNQAISNVVAACHECHMAYHLNAKAFLPMLRAWAERHAYTLPRRKPFL